MKLKQNFDKPKKISEENAVMLTKNYVLHIRAQNGHTLHSDEKLRRRLILFVSFTSALFPTLSSYAKTKSKSPYDERRLLEQNKRRQRENNAPEDFPNFIREGLFIALFAYVIVHNIIF